MTEPATLRVEMLEVVYHRTITAVQGISLAAEAGQIVAVLGTNGAGKSTTLRAISGFLGIDDARITDGSVTFKARRIENRPPNEIARLGVVLVPERDKVFPNLTVAENLAAPFAPSARVQFVPSPPCVHPTSALTRSPQAPRSKPLTHYAALKDAMRRTKAASVVHSPSSHCDVRRPTDGSCNHWYASRDCPLRCIGAEQE